MIKRERVISAISHKQPDFAPYCVGFTHQEYYKVAEYLSDIDFLDKIGNHISDVYYCGYLTEMEASSGYWKDDFGVVWNRNGADKDIGVLDGIVLKEPSLKKYRFPEIDEEKLRSEYEAMISCEDGTFKLGSIGFSMFERAWTLRGMENLLTDMILYPEFVDELLEAITEHNLKIIEIALDYDIDGFHIGDDWGQQKGLIMGPRLWRRFIKPVMAKMYGKVKTRGKFVSQHSCGDIHEIFPDLIEIGLDIFQTVQPEIYNLADLKQNYGKDLTFWGGISTQRLLPFATPEEVKRVTAETIRLMGNGGGYIAGPTHSIPCDVPVANVLAMLEVLQNQS